MVHNNAARESLIKQTYGVVVTLLYQVTKKSRDRYTRDTKVAVGSPYAFFL